jgi:hypothetical protein
LTVAAARAGGHTNRERARRRWEELGLTAPAPVPDPPPAAPWSVEEDALVRALPPWQAAETTGRPLKAVYARRQQLRVKGGPAAPARADGPAAGR